MSPDVFADYITDLLNGDIVCVWDAQDWIPFEAFLLSIH